MMICKGDNRLVSTIRAILLIQLGDIGDVILTLPCILALREAYPRADIQVAVHDKAAGLIRECPWATGVIPVRKTGQGVGGKAWAQVLFIRQLRKHRFDLAIDLRTGTRGAIMAMLSGARQRIGFYADDGGLWRNRIFTNLLQHDYRPGQYVADYLLDLLAEFGVQPSRRTPFYPVSEERCQEARELLEGQGIAGQRPVIAIQPFSLWSYKELPEESLVSLIRKIKEHFLFDIVLVGGSGESEKARDLLALLDNAAFNLVGKTSIAILPAVLKLCALFIGIDSAGLHIAAAVGTKTVAIFGPSSPESWAPRGDEHTVIQPNFPCLPCREKGCGNSEISQCLTTFDPLVIFQKIHPLLARL